MRYDDDDDEATHYGDDTDTYLYSTESNNNDDNGYIEAKDSNPTFTSLNINNQQEQQQVKEEDAGTIPTIAITNSKEEEGKENEQQQQQQGQQIHNTININSNKAIKTVQINDNNNLIHHPYNNNNQRTPTNNNVLRQPLTVSMISQISDTSSISIAFEPPDDEHEVISMMGARKKSELDFTMGYIADDELEIDGLMVMDPKHRNSPIIPGMVLTDSYRSDHSSIFNPKLDQYQQQLALLHQKQLHNQHLNRMNNNIDNQNNNNNININNNGNGDGRDMMISHDQFIMDMIKDNNREKNNNRNGNGIRNGNNDNDDNNNNNNMDKFKKKLKEYDCAAPYIKLLRDNKAYRLLFFSSLISLMGDWFNELACLTLLARFEATGLMVSLFLVLRECPPFLFSPISGVVSDKFDRKRVMLVADILRMFLVLAFLFVRNRESIWLLYVLAFTQFTIGAFFMPAKSALLPMLVKKSDIITAIAAEQSCYSSMMLLGASIGGVVSYGLGTDANYLIDSGTYLASAICILLLMKLLNSKDWYFEQEDEEEEDSDQETEVEMRDGKLLNNDREEEEDEDDEEDIDEALTISNHHIKHSHLDNQDEDEDEDQNQDIGLTSVNDQHIELEPHFEDIDIEQLESNNKQSSSNNHQQQQKKTGVWGSIVEYCRLYKEGLVYLKNNPYIWTVVFTKACGALVWGGVDAVLIRYSETIFRYGTDGSLGLGLILGCGGLGILLIPFVFARVVKDKPENHNRILKFGFLLNFLATLLLGYSSKIAFPLFLFFNVIRSSSTCILWLYSSSILQQLVDDKVKGRVFSFEYGVLTITAVFAKMACGFMLDNMNYTPQTITYVYGVIGMVIFFTWVMLLDKNKRN